MTELPASMFAKRFDRLPVPDRVAIVGNGPSRVDYVDLTTRLGGRREMFDEVWGINQVSDVFGCDRGFHMDNVRVQEIRSQRHAKLKAIATELLTGGTAIAVGRRIELETDFGFGNLNQAIASCARDLAEQTGLNESDAALIDMATRKIASDRAKALEVAANGSDGVGGMLRWLRNHPGPIYTSVPHEDYPGLIPYPLADVMNSLGRMAYFNSTAAYAVALAVHLGVKKLYVFGCDFTYPNVKQAEQGRACVEFYLGMGRARGMVIGLPNTSLMDGIATNKERLYGYDGVDVAFVDKASEPLALTFTPCGLPTAIEIEARYDHSQHPNPLMRAAA
jgi:hypothetical protein